ncbi:MAG: glycosyltransferase [Fusobacteriaceae bacterium]
MNKKKILFYTSGIGLGGVEKVLLEILKALDKEKFDIKVAFQYGDENLYENEIPNSVNFRYMLSKKEVEKTLKTREKKTLWNKIKYSFRLKKEKDIIKKNYLDYSKDRDIVIDFKSGDFSKLVFKNKKAKKIIWFHTSITKLNRYKKRKNLIKNLLEKADKVVCICEEMKEELLDEFQNISKNINVIYNGLDFQTILKKSIYKDSLNEIENNLITENYILMVARLEEKMKDFNTLIKAFEKVLKIKKDLKLYLVGDGPDKEKIQNKINDLKLTEKVLLLGRKDNPYVWMKNAELIVHSSLYEGLPTVLLEGLVLKKKIVSTNFKTGASEILDNGRLGKIVPIGDADKMANAIIKLLENGKELEKELNKETLDKFNKNTTILEIENLFKSLEKN